ncbi:MAG: chromosomal replication initiation protein [Rickettsiaceae bacterium]|jgi:chromosomal replication initiator protein|nr:chromosomal replication initiation protein [Rickettsiaceae bacterium]
MLVNQVASLAANNNHYYENLWIQIQQDLTKKFGEAVYKSWFSKISLIDSSSNEIVLAVPTKFMKDWVQTNYFELISHLWMHYDSNIMNVELIVSETAQTQSAPLFNIKPEDEDPAQAGTANSNDVFSQSALDPRFTFKSFVVGTSNAFAFEAALAVAESKKAVSESNPLFLYGGVGLGKTHLMHAIAHHIRQIDPNRKVVYMSAEKFMYQFVKALRNKDVMSFKEHFRSVDVLMIDDIQFICGKDSTQEEFFHTFNALMGDNRQMVISCDRSPSDLDNIEDRIKSRLGWGLVADVHSTTYELRLGILQSKIEQMNVHVPLNVLEFLAAKISSNVRELEGALNKVIAHSTLVGREINIESTQEILRDLLRSNERVVTIEEIQRKVSERYNIKLSDMSSDKRLRSVARPRQIAMFLAKQLTSKSLTDIGKKFGKKDHTTVIHAVRKIEELCNSDLELQEEIHLLTRILQS